MSREVGIFPPNNFPVQYLGRESDGRTGVYSQTDLYVQHEFKMAGQRRPGEPERAEPVRSGGVPWKHDVPLEGTTASPSTRPPSTAGNSISTS